MARSIAAVIAGFAATLMLSMIGGAPLGRVAPPGHLGSLPASQAVMATGVLVALASAVAGGFLAGMIARRHEVMHALVLGTLGAVSALAMIVAAPAAERTIGTFISAMLMIPATVLGGSPERVVATLVSGETRYEKGGKAWLELIDAARNARSRLLSPAARTS